MNTVIKSDPLESHLAALTTKAWGFWHASKRNGKPTISYQDAAVKAIEGNNELALPSDALSRVSVQSIVSRMQARATEIKSENREVELAKKAQQGFGFVATVVASKESLQKKQKASQEVLL